MLSLMSTLLRLDMVLIEVIRDYASIFRLLDVVLEGYS